MSFIQNRKPHCVLGFCLVHHGVPEMVRGEEPVILLYTLEMSLEEAQHCARVYTQHSRPELRSVGHSHGRWLKGWDPARSMTGHFSLYQSFPRT